VQCARRIRTSRRRFSWQRSFVPTYYNISRYLFVPNNPLYTAYPVHSADSGGSSDIDRRIDRRAFVHRNLPSAVGCCVERPLPSLPVTEYRQPASSDRRLWRQFTDSTAVSDFPAARHLPRDRRLRRSGPCPCDFGFLFFIRLRLLRRGE